jgi:hypothetical protein
MMESIFGCCDKYFDFLKEYGFSEPIEYPVPQEMHRDYVKGNIIITIVYDGGYCVNYCKTMKIIPQLEMGDLKLRDVDVKEKKYYDLRFLDCKLRLFKSIDFKNNEQILSYYAKLLKGNPEVLDGNLDKFKLSYKDLRYWVRRA